jgi:hypothetical protein
MVRTREKQTINLPDPVDANSATALDDKFIRQELVKAGKRQMKLSKPPTKAYTTVYGECSDNIKENLEVSSNWERIQNKQLLRKLIQKIKRICVGFGDHK